MFDGLRRKPSINDANILFPPSAMGKSRSATILLAYLLWRSRQSTSSTSKNIAPSSVDSDVVALPPKPLSVEEALMQLRQGRPIAEPNEGFMEQLYMYVDMGCPNTLVEIQSHKLYRRFINRLNVAESLSVNQAPDVLDIRFEDEADEDIPKASPKENNKETQEVVPGVSAPTGAGDSNSATQMTKQIRCRRCRHVLATTPHILEHTPSRSDPSSQPCGHVYLHPLSWMKETLAEGALDGRLSCPGKNCGVNVGKFAWQGMRCSCGGWVTPGFGVVKTKVDEVVQRGGSSAGSDAAVSAQQSGGGIGIRLPPGMRRGGNL